MPPSTRAYGCLLSQLVIRSVIYSISLHVRFGWYLHESCWVEGWQLRHRLADTGKSNWAGGWAAGYHSWHLKAWSSPGAALLTNHGWSQWSVSELLVPLFPNWIWSRGIYVVASFSNPWFIPGSFCASLAAVHVTLALQNLWHGESFRCYFNKPEQHPEGKPFQASHSTGGCRQSCPRVSPQGLQQENVTNKSHCKLLLFTMTS